MKIFITGGSGFIGSHITDFHLRRGDEVRVIDDLSTGTLNNILPFQNNSSFHFENDDLLTWPGLSEAVNWADRIYHLAAVVGIFRVLAEPLKVMQTNVIATDRLFQLASIRPSLPHIVFASSSSVYGPSPKLILNEDDGLMVEAEGYPLRLYAISKLSDEALATAYHATYQLPFTILRFFNVVGPRQTGAYGMVIPRFVKQAYRNEPLTVFGDGSQTRSFCDVRDVTTALDLLMKNTDIRYEVINVGNNREITINELAELVRTRAHSHSEIRHIPYREAYGIDFRDITKRHPDLSKLKKLTGYSPQYTLEQTIDDLLTLEAKKNPT